MQKIKDALIEAQGWVMEAGACFIDGWRVSADWVAIHKNWSLLIGVALIVGLICK